MSYTLTPEIWEAHRQQATELMEELRSRDIMPGVVLIIAARILRKNLRGMGLAALGALVEQGEEEFGKWLADASPTNRDLD